MDDTIFKKLKVKHGMTATLLYAPSEYPDYDGFSNIKEVKDDFVHLFITSRAEFNERFSEAAESVPENGLFWISYPKSSGKQKYDINRDSLWDLLILHEWHPVAQVSLDETWSAVQLKRNESDVVYERPNNTKGSRKNV